jgi:hypothetical protein
MANSSELAFKVVAEKNLAMRNRDGVGADVYRPNAPGKFPVLVMRTATC